jgi:methionyl-tRNA formyltransferase
VLQPPKIRAVEVREQLQEIAPDAIVVIAYGQILPESILRIPKAGCLNVHASLLPKYRGAAPIQWAIIRGEQETGITTMFMDKGMDTGDMLLQQRVPIAPEDTAGSLHDTLARVGADVLIRTLQGLADGSVEPIPQNHEEATYAPLLTKEDGLIDWHDSAINIHNKVRGMFPWPGAFTHFRGKVVKVLKVMVASGEVVASEEAVECSFSPGTVVALDNTEGPLIATSEGLIRILEIQPENRKPMRCSDFCRGYHLAIGDRLTG